MALKDIWKNKRDGAAGDTIYAEDIVNGGINQIAASAIDSENATRELGLEILDLSVRKADKSTTLSGYGITDAFNSNSPVLMNNKLIAGNVNDNGALTATKTIDWNKGNHQKITIGTGSYAIAFAAPSKPCALSLIIVENTGAFTLPAIKWQGGIAPTWTKAAGTIDMLSLFYDGTYYYGMVSLDWR